MVGIKGGRGGGGGEKHSWIFGESLQPNLLLNCKVNSSDLGVSEGG